MNTKDTDISRIVEHLVEGRDSWSVGYAGLILRLRSIVGTIILSLFTGGMFDWWAFTQRHPFWTNDVTVPFRTALFASVASGVSLILIGILVIRVNTIRSLNLKWSLHDITHFLRDRISSAERFSADSNKSKERCHSEETLRNVSAEVSNKIRDYFKVLIRDSSVEAGIRIADRPNRDSKSEEVFYCTAGRSSGLNPSRDATSEPIPANAGVPRFFIECKECKGVLVFHDLNRAIELGIYQKTKNDDQYGHESSSIMIAPINGWTGKRTDMIGLLYITSRKDVFRIAHVDPMKAIADILGICIPRLVELYWDKRRANRVKGGD